MAAFRGEHELADYLLSLDSSMIVAAGTMSAVTGQEPARNIESASKLPTPEQQLGGRVETSPQQLASDRTIVEEATYQLC